MRFQGRITDWNDDKGFGFVSPNGGGPRVFVHIKAFSNRQRRPTGGELVSYEVGADTRGRPRASNVAHVGDRSSAPPPTSAPGPGSLALGLACAFLAVVILAVIAGRLPLPALLAYIGMSAVTYLAYVLDKAAAVQARRRTPENHLHFLSLLCGWPGAMLAQRTLRHKTQKKSFQLNFWATVAANSIALGWFLTAPGMRFARSLLGSA